LRIFKTNGNNVRWIGLALWYLTPFSTIFQLYHGDHFYWRRTSEYPGKTTIMTVPNSNGKIVERGKNDT
jgi:hypothetical protein